jgi:23S rRNA pseudouridine1911/1915/1917 synthase
MIISQRARANVALKSWDAPVWDASVLEASVWDAAVFSDGLLDPLGMTLTIATKSIVAAEEQAGERLDRMLAASFGEFSRSRLKALIEAGAVAIDGATIRDPSHRVNSGAAIVLNVPPPEPARPAAEAIPLKIVYEDDDIIVIDKPANLVVHPAAGHWTGTLVNALIAHCGDSLSGIGGERRPGIVHRLDKDTTGLMVVAKNDHAHQALSAQFASHGRNGEPFERGYLAFAWGAPERPRGTIDRPIDRSPHARDHMAVREGGREAVTHWEVLERYPGISEGPRAGTGSKAKSGARSGSKSLAKSEANPVASLLACRLETGRTHQIRVHLASIGHPILGDDVYGAGFRTKRALLASNAQAALVDLGRQALHAHILSVKHPTSGEFLRFRSELPPDLARLHNALVGGRVESSELPSGKG